MRRWATLGILMALVSSQAGAQPPQVVTQPDWSTKPTGDDVSRAYPKLALELAIEGRASIRCQIDEGGLLRDCALEGEFPKALGFGDAAMSLASRFRMRPMQVAGHPVGGAEVRIPLLFKYPADDPPAAPRPAAGALQLARQYVAASRAAEVMERGREDLARELERLPSAAAPDAAAAVREATRAAGPELREALAQRYAAEWPISRLQSKLRHPAVQHRLDGVMTELWGAYAINVARRAGDLFCAKHPCGPRPPVFPLAPTP